MKSHVQNPWTRSPQLFVHMTVEEAGQLLGYLRSRDLGVPCTANQGDAFEQLKRTLEHAFQTDRPHGVKGVVP